MLQAVTEFEKLWALGYTRLVPIIPPDARIGETSSLYKRIGTRQDARGKTPGTLGRNGCWYGFDWVPYEAEPEDLTRWAGMGAGVGIKTGHGLHAIDADTLDARCAEIVRDTVRAHFGHTPIRVGQYPKALYLIRVDGDLPYTRVEFGAPDAHGVKERVEVLGERKQFVAHGVHKKTGQPYTWPSPLTPFDDLTPHAPEKVMAFMEALRSALPEADKPITEGAGTDVSQEALRGDTEAVRRAVAATPNTSRHFPSRESYRDMGYAIKAAIPDDPNEAFDIFAEWCTRWDEGTNDPDVIAADWRRMKPPYRRGASWLYEQAEQLSGGAFTQAQVHFDPIPETAPSPFDVQAKAEAAEQAPAIRATPFDFPDPAAIPRREWLYGNHYIRKFVSTTVAPSGVGKSSLTIVEALAMASGKPLLGAMPKGQFRVWLWNGEDPMDELQRRVTAAMLHYGLTREDVGDRLFLDSGRDMEIVLATTTRSGAVIAEPNVEAMCRAIRDNRIDVVTIDPFVSTHRVAENDNMAVDLVTKKWAWIADRCNCGIELVHHVRKMNGNETTVEDSRGAVSLIATSRSARAISKMTRQEAAKLGLEDRAGRLFRFSDGKNNLAPPADLSAAWMQLVSVGLGNGLGGGMDAVLNGDSVGVVALFDGAAQAAATAGHEGDMRAVLAELKAGASGGEGGGWRLDARSPDWAGHAVAAALTLDVSAPESKTKATTILQAMKAAGLISFVWKLDAKRRRKQFVEVVENTEYECHTNAGVFG